ncbi:RDD family protein [Actinocorallia sp. API 0066]|uniref:RDD family protein n=1 Tax=Actinocorallia sp. API 0066 TaxID=2896846 RepID=UPI001E546273|nr:RDD family protein [Actinocorallia sp. API 0066]MCD0451207.1 RDD family protein [Actinocorallia sp. API 0066]
MTVASEELVTGEAVALDIRPARLASRAAALLLDLAIMLSVMSTLAQAVQFVVLFADEAVAIGLGIVVVVGSVVGYPSVSETLTRGKTVGKMALGLRVVAEDGGVVRFRQSLMRALTGFVEFFLFLGAPALICSLFDRRGRRLGDIFAGTLVIQDRTAASAAAVPPPALMPPHLAPWAAALELSQVSDDLALSVRQYLQRYWELLPEVRASMGASLLAEVAPLLSPPPPPGNPPELLLSAVVTERRTREERRLAARTARRVAHLQKLGQHIPQPPPPQPVYFPHSPTAFLPQFLPLGPSPYGPPPQR